MVVVHQSAQQRMHKLMSGKKDRRPMADVSDSEV